MREIEITVKVNNSLEEIQDILINQGFKKIETYRMYDKYLTLKQDDITKDNALDILKSCLLLRHLFLEDNKEKKMLTYKQKEYDGSVVISDTKINVLVDDLEKTEELLLKQGYKNIVEVDDTLYVYEKDDLSIAIEDVKDLGILLEYENDKDFTGYSNEEIIKEKEIMFKKLKDLNLNLEDDYNIKKAYELLIK